MLLRREEELRQVCKAGFNSCILAAPYVEVGALHSVLPLLAPSAPFAVYSLWLQPLAQAAQQLMVRLSIVRLESKFTNLLLTVLQLVKHRLKPCLEGQPQCGTTICACHTA
jgi:hypothetical protein